MSADHPRRRQNRVERWLEATLFASRWLLAPFYVGLVVALIALLGVFVKELIHEIARPPGLEAEDAILMALSLVDLSLAGNLILLVIFSGYENFVSKFDIGEQRGGPAWMGAVDFSGLKLKLVASIVAIAGISLLHSFMKLGARPVDEAELKWSVIILLTFVVSGVLLSLMDFLATRSPHPRD